jgi:hypothetical protein
LNPCLKCHARQCLFDVLHDGLLGSTDGGSLRRRLRRSTEADKNEKKEETLRVTRAMEAGIADHVWSIEEIVALLA